MMRAEGKAYLCANLKTTRGSQKDNIWWLKWIFWREQDATVIDPTRKFRVVGSPDGEVPANNRQRGIINESMGE